MSSRSDAGHAAYYNMLYDSRPQCISALSLKVVQRTRGALATRQINKIPRALPEPIRARATEVPVFFSPARDELGHYFGWDEGQIANVCLA